MIPTNFLNMSSRYNIMPDEEITSILSLTVPNSDEELIAHWSAWKNQVPNDSNERRDIALANLAEYMHCSSNAEYALDLSGLNLSELPAYWPSDLATLDVSNNNLITLSTTFPLSLSYLDAQNNRLTSLPENLPPGLTDLDVSNNLLTILFTNVPESLESLTADNNYITQWPENLFSYDRYVSYHNNPVQPVTENRSDLTDEIS